MEKRVIIGKNFPCTLREFYDVDNGISGLEVWDKTDKKCLLTLDGFYLIDEEDPDYATLWETMLDEIEMELRENWNL
jgi:hypothetical protein